MMPILGAATVRADVASGFPCPERLRCLCAHYHGVVGLPVGLLGIVLGIMAIVRRERLLLLAILGILLDLAVLIMSAVFWMAVRS
jgi:hypothetical protein